MPLTVFLTVLLAALLHASWSAVVKGGRDKLLTMVVVTASAALTAMVALPFLPAPACPSWPFIAASTVIHWGYFILVARTFRVAEMSLAYPIMRGSAPMLVALSSVIWLGEILSVPAWTGLSLICLGVLTMAAGVRLKNQAEGIALSLLNAMTIAAYTLVDGTGVRLSAAPAAYTLWIFLLSGLPLALWALARRRAAFLAYVGRDWRLGLAGGLAAVTSYGLALWAMTAAPVAVVAALRETAILFGAAISALLLKEKIGKSRLAAVCLIALGAAVLRLA